MLLILTATVTNRLRYIVDLMIRDLLGLEVELTTSADEFLAFRGSKLAYTASPFPGEINIDPAGLLFEEGVRQQGLKTTWNGTVPILYQSESPGFSLSFDPFASSFYVVSRYEEYLPYIKDGYGRFPVTASIAWEGRFLDIPVVHLWSDMVGTLLQQQYPAIAIRRHEYRFVPTIDVDHAYSYRCRPLARTLGGIGRSALHFEFPDITRRLMVLANITTDPFDTFDYIFKTLEPAGVNPLFFILFADYGGDDNGVTTKSRTFHRLIRDLDRHQGVGMHPSLSSNKHYLKLQSECEGLSAVVDRNVTNSRQHFLKVSIPRTYRALVQLGITHDYSMGYASNPGFRAGIAAPFPFFDLSRNLTTLLTIHPIILMDVTMRDYRRLNIERSIEMTRNLVSTVKSVNGEFVSLWHNESLAENGRWLGWRRVFEEMVKMASV
ncbi:MAG: polysaccharide deacetylase family protein [Bacteroidota bacterium]